MWFSFNRQVGSIDGSLWTHRRAFYAIFCRRTIGHHRQPIISLIPTAYRVAIEASTLMRLARAVDLRIAQRQTLAPHRDGR